MVLELLIIMIIIIGMTKLIIGLAIKGAYERGGGSVGHPTTLFPTFPI